MNGNEYQTLAMRTNDGKASDRLDENLAKYFAESMILKKENVVPNIGEVFNACLGMSGEVGELNDLVKKWIFHEKPLDEEHLKKELGDVLWYVAQFCHSFGWSLDDVMELNIEKLKERYPDGFDVERANNRKIGDI